MIASLPISSYLTLKYQLDPVCVFANGWMVIVRVCQKNNVKIKERKLELAAAL